MTFVSPVQGMVTRRHGAHSTVPDLALLSHVSSTIFTLLVLPTAAVLLVVLDVAALASLLLFHQRRCLMLLRNELVHCLHFEPGQDTLMSRLTPFGTHPRPR